MSEQLKYFFAVYTTTMSVSTQISTCNTSFFSKLNGSYHILIMIINYLFHGNTRLCIKAIYIPVCSLFLRAVNIGGIIGGILAALAIICALIIFIPILICCLCGVGIGAACGCACCQIRKAAKSAPV